MIIFIRCRCTSPCPELADFLVNKQIKFASVDIRCDRRMLEQENIVIPAEFHVDLQDLFKTRRTYEAPAPYDRDGMADLAGKIIDITCSWIKDDFPWGGHDKWEEERLPALNLEYAARDAYFSYDMYKRMVTIREGMLRAARKAEATAPAEAQAAAAAAEAQAAAASAEAQAAAAVEDAVNEEPEAREEEASDAMNATAAAGAGQSSLKRSRWSPDPATRQEIIPTGFQYVGAFCDV